MKSLSNLFRTLNSKLITTDNILIEKILKLCFALSVFIYKQHRKKSAVSNPIVIDNFDADIKMKIDSAHSIGSSIYWTGFHEFRELLFLNRYLKPHMTFVDVGANQGEYSLFAAKRLTNGKVLAFEPLPSIRKAFTNNILLNNFTNIQVYDCGLSDKTCNLQFHEVVDDQAFGNEGLSTLYPGNKKTASTITILVKSLDEILADEPQLKIDFIKLDIEGGELFALKGSLRTIERFKPTIMIEINDTSYHAAGYSSDDVKDFFKNIGYYPYVIGKRGRLTACNSMPAFGNIVFKP